MKRNDEIRRLLREADPAESRELSPVERARMRAAMTGAAFGGRSARRRYFVALAIGAAVTVAAIAFVAFSPRHEQRSVVVGPPANESPPTPPLLPPAVEATTKPVVAALPPRRKRAHERPQVARLEGAERATHIVFTGPDGTKILWFVGNPRS